MFVHSRESPAVDLCDDIATNERCTLFQCGNATSRYRCDDAEKAAIWREKTIRTPCRLANRLHTGLPGGRRSRAERRPPQPSRIHSSVSGPAARLCVVVLIVSYSVTRTTPGIGSSTTSMIVSSITGTLCLGALLGAIFAAVFGTRFFGVARFDAFLRAGLALAFPRFEAFLRVARRFLALAMAVPCEVCSGEPISKQSNSANIIRQQSAAPLLIELPNRSSAARTKLQERSPKRSPSRSM
jgi:hypothetical protein